MLNIRFTDSFNDESFLSFSSKKIRRYSIADASVISIADYFSPERKKVEEFIENIYESKYGAKITSHYPILMSVRDSAGNIIAALGFRYGAKENLFLEQYLDEPAQNIVSEKFKDINLERGDLVEVGSLASIGGGASIFLYTALTAYLQKQGKKYIIVTATQFLRKYFAKLGLRPKFISKADNSRLSDKGASWGSYYASEPEVIAGDIDSACRMLKKHLKAELKDSDNDYLARIHFKENI